MRRLRSGDMAIFASLDNLGRLLLTPAALDTAIVYEVISTVTIAKQTLLTVMHLFV